MKEYNTGRRRALKIAGICGFIFLCLLTAVLLINSLLCVFVDHYYPTFGKYRLFAIVSDSMEPEIPTGDMIVGYVPQSEEDIEVGTVITYELTQGNSTVLITHRVTEIHYDEATGVTTYTTQGDNTDRADTVRPAFADVVGVYTGNKCGFFGYFFGFLQSSEGAIALIVIALIIVITAIIVHFVNVVSIWRTAALHALDKSSAMLKSENGEVDLQTIADVLGIVIKDPNDRLDLSRKDKKLKWFVQTGMLPERPYADDLDEYLATLEQRKRQAAEGGVQAEPAQEVEDLSLTWEEILRRAEELIERAEKVRLTAGGEQRAEADEAAEEPLAEEEVAETPEEVAEELPAELSDEEQPAAEDGEEKGFDVEYYFSILDQLEKIILVCNGVQERLGALKEQAEGEAAEKAEHIVETCASVIERAQALKARLNGLVQ